MLSPSLPLRYAQGCGSLRVTLHHVMCTSLPSASRDRPFPFATLRAAAHFAQGDRHYRCCLLNFIIGAGRSLPAPQAGLLGPYDSSSSQPSQVVFSSKWVGTRSSAGTAGKPTYTKATICSAGTSPNHCLTRGS